MRPDQLSAASFHAYPPEARGIAESSIALLQQLPLAFLPLLLRELIGYDWKFPVERSDLDFQISYLREKSATQLESLMHAFAQLSVAAELENLDWVNVPAEFSERLSAHLWASRQIDNFRAASTQYVHGLNAAKPVSAPAMPRLGIVLVGRDATKNRASFQKLLPLGTHYTNVTPQAIPVLLDLVEARAAAHKEAFAHWYIDGAECLSAPSGVACVSYTGLRPVRKALLLNMTKMMGPNGGGPEMLRSELQRMRPEDAGFTGDTNKVLSRFELSLLTEGSGTQIFSTTFVQWAAREVLRRAQPYTLLARFAARQREAAIDSSTAATPDALDPEGSLVDAEMGAYYTWINQQRLPHAEQSRFVVWDESHNQAVALAPALKGGSEQAAPVRIDELIANLS